MLKNIIRLVDYQNYFKIIEHLRRTDYFNKNCRSSIENEIASAVQFKFFGRIKTDLRGNILKIILKYLLSLFMKKTDVFLKNLYSACIEPLGKIQFLW